MVYRVLGEITMVVHFVALLYMALGGFLAWIWPRAIFPHIVMTVWAVVIVLGAQCPLTYLENYFRERAGDAVLQDGFIETYIEGVVYPREDLVLVRICVGIVIAVSWFGAYMRWRAKRHAKTKSGRAAK